jgi:glycerol kinase
MTRIIALDQGTTSTRALCLGPDGRAEVVASRTHRQFHPRQGWVEHDPEELLGHLTECLAAAVDPGEPAVIGLANQGESCLAWEAGTGRPVSPVIVWQDSRTEGMTAGLVAAGLAAEVSARAGLPLDPYFSASKLAWILRENPEARALARCGRLRLGTTDAFFRERLTGRCETDRATASRTSLMNLATGEWDDRLCAIFGVPREALPPIGPCAGFLGEVGPRGRGVLGASIVDQQAALFGHGCRAPGEGKITFGTGAFALVLTEGGRGLSTGGLLPTVAWTLPDGGVRHALDGGVYSASAAVNWARGLGLFRDFAEIDAFDAPAAIDRGIAFVPALAGLACPHWDRRARGAWLGLDLASETRDLMQALLEGVALRTAEVMAVIGQIQPVAAPVSIDGGMTANGYFVQFLADVLGRAVRVAAERELTAAGVARMAAEAHGIMLPPAAGGRIVEPRPAPLAARRTRFAGALEAIGTYARADPDAGTWASTAP